VLLALAEGTLEEIADEGAEARLLGRIRGEGVDAGRIAPRFHPVEPGFQPARADAAGSQ
jgi:hypothetical protein